MGTLMSRLARLEQRQGGEGAPVMGVVTDDDYEGDRADAVTVQPGGERCSVAEFSRRWPQGILVILQTWGEPDDASSGAAMGMGG
jgi:hypothetical protein